MTPAVRAWVTTAAVLATVVGLTRLPPAPSWWQVAVAAVIGAAAAVVMRRDGREFARITERERRDDALREVRR